MKRVADAEDQVAQEAVRGEYRPDSQTDGEQQPEHGPGPSHPGPDCCGESDDHRSDDAIDQWQVLLGVGVSAPDAVEDVLGVRPDECQSEDRNESCAFGPQLGLSRWDLIALRSLLNRICGEVRGAKPCDGEPDRSADEQGA